MSRVALVALAHTLMMQSDEAVMYTQKDKLCELDQLVDHVCDNDCLAIGGGLSWREPMAALRALIRKGVRELTLVGSAHGIDVDLLCGADCVSVSGESYVGFEQDFGMAPNYRRACESGSVQVQDSCCYTLVQQLRATIAGLPFMPIRSIKGTGFMQLHPQFQTMICPYSGDELVLLPALQPDVAIIHVQYADRHGNLHIEGPPVTDVLFAKSSKKVLATVERLISSEQLAEMGVSIPYFYVTAISVVEYGAHPTACYPFYAYDRNHTSAYHRSASQGVKQFIEQYLQPYVYSCCEHHDYLEAVGGEETLQRLETWNQGREAWMALYE